MMHLDESSVMSLPDSPVEPDEMEDAQGSSAEAVTLEQASLKVSKLLKGKGREWDGAAQQKRPLTLLELPIDILRLIVKEVIHTNDLTSLALTNSTLHSLAIPHIYARFDIVWPDTTATTSDAKSVDALTYGLSTLSLGSSFSTVRQRLARLGSARPSRPPFNIMGNNYAVHTRKFSLGNGPEDWVAEYMITKESGKMLGTLVAMAVAKMANLETFSWDMPTGVLAEIFLALASLADHHPSGECNLERVWVRWHDNNESAAASASSNSTPATPQQASVPLGTTVTPIGIMLPTSATHPKPRKALTYSESPVEYPTFSVLPPLRSLSVLDIDELAYVDEMAMLIERSKDRLQELRVGVSARAVHKDFVQSWDGPGLQQVDHDAHWPGASTIGDRRLGGILGVLVGRVYDIRRKVGLRPKDKSPTGGTTSPAPDPAVGSSAAGVAGSQTDSADGDESRGLKSEQSHSVEQQNASSSSGMPPSEQQDHDSEPSPKEDQDNGGQGSSAAAASAESSVAKNAQAPSTQKGSQQKRPLTKKEKEKAKSKAASEGVGRTRLEGKLRLHSLELERIPLSIQVCSKAIDWTTVTNLAILDCAQHEALWKLLRRQFQPTPMGAGLGIASSSSRQPATGTPQLQYHLNLKRIHTDITSTALISFIKEVLAPNTLEVLFLQDRRKPPGPQSVTLDNIFRGAIKRHRLSLRKLLLDSSTKPVNVPPGPPENTRWRHWVLNTSLVLYITSGRMRNLRELAVSLAYSDWHLFLQRLPNVPQLRSLNIPHVADHLVGNFEPKELALQIADIITLRPEIQLCYVGISTKCFEILESSPGDRGGGLGSSLVNGENGHDTSGGGNASSSSNALAGPGAAATSGPSVNNVITAEDDSEDGGHQSDTSEEDHSGAESHDGEGGGTPSNATDPDETQSESHSDAGPESDDDFVDPDQQSPARATLRLREILFYDDKVAIFKARHGRL